MTPNLEDESVPFLDDDSVISHSYQSSRRTIASSYYGETESQQYEQDESEVWWHHQLQRHFEDRGHWWTFARKRDVLRWLLTLVTGFLCGLVAFFVTFFTKSISNFKFSTFNLLLEREKEGTLLFGTAFLFLFMCNVALGFIAWCAVYFEPLAAGSGIPEVKCFLNGLNIPRLVRFRTLICKAIGIVFSCSSGLPLGKEGPMVHVGAVIAAGVSQGKSVTFGMDTSFSKYQDFRNDREKRDFVACGAAAGVAAAFGAPIGGVLFSLEEGASFWSTKLTWRCFFCAMTTVFTLYVINTAKSLFGHSDITAMFSFGEFFSLQSEKSNYSVWELSLFLIVGCLGGLIGAIFNNCTDKIFHWRSVNVTKRSSKLIEVLIVTSLMSSFALFLSLFWTKCTPLPVDMEGWSDQEKSLVEELVALYCPSETHYNELASLYLTDSDTSIRQLFHFREVGDHNDSTFSSAALFLFFIPYIFVSCLTYGLAVPAGMFVPSLMSGAAFGRLLGHLLHKLDNARGTFADSGTYALMGAAAITSGIARMTISLTVMILEATGDMQYVLPLMLTVMSARLIGNIFTEGLYDIHIHNRNLNFLDEDEGISKLVDLHDLSVSEIMTKKPYYMLPVMRVGEAFDVMRKQKHHCYPVVDDKDDNVLVGTIMRKVVCTLIKHRAFGSPTSDPTSSKRISPLVNWGTLECIYPRYPDINDLVISDSDRLFWLDLRPYIDSSPYTINEHASVQRTYRMFRTLGLRHLTVINRHNQVLGIITRADLVAAHLLGNNRVEAERRKSKRRKKNKNRKNNPQHSATNSFDENTLL
eukprot:gene4229-6005_t